MRKIFFSFIAALLILGCSDDNSNESPFNNQEPGTVMFTIDGVEYILREDDQEANTCFDACLTNPELPLLWLRMFNPNDNSWMVVSSTNIEPGTYDLGNTTSDNPSICNNYAAYGILNVDDLDLRYFSNDDIGGSGQLTMIEFDATEELTSGTFQFTAVQLNGSGQSIIVTNGSFYKIRLRGFGGCTGPFFGG